MNYVKNMPEAAANAATQREILSLCRSYFFAIRITQLKVK